MRWNLMWLCLSLWLVGCSTAPTSLQSDAHSIARNYQANADIESWQLTGKLGVLAPNNGGVVHFNWQQAGADFVVQLSGPLGIGGSRIEGNDQLIKLYDDHNQLIASSDTAELLQQYLGFNLPLAELASWIKGVPIADNGQIHYRLNSAGNLKTLDQKGWHLSYPTYMKVATYSLPKKLLMVHENLELRFALQSWQLNHG